MDTTLDAMPDASVAPAQVRLSTLRRIEKLKSLVAELSERQLDVPAAARFLRCSTSTARNYIIELCDAAIVVPLFGTASDCAADGLSYHLIAPVDSAQMRHFMEDLAAPRICGASMSMGKRRAGLRCGARYFHILADDVKFALKLSVAPAQRDPLVAALFGVPATGGPPPAG